MNELMQLIKTFWQKITKKEDDIFNDPFLIL
jgi:hypothetical protein